MVEIEMVSWNSVVSSSIVGKVEKVVGLGMYIVIIMIKLEMYRFKVMSMFSSYIGMGSISMNMMLMMKVVMISLVCWVSLVVNLLSVINILIFCMFFFRDWWCMVFWMFCLY